MSICSARPGACRTWSVESENRPQRGQFLPDLQPHSQSMGQKGGEKWTAAVDLQPTISKSDRHPIAFLGDTGHWRNQLDFRYRPERTLVTSPQQLITSPQQLIFCITMKTPNQDKDRLWQGFQEKSGLATPSRGFVAVIVVIAAILIAPVVAAIFQ
ncbi:hypothetical protein [Acidovorax sp.]|uniref:hypothetical protein n=1 Tax=Acidovorax sp. TaxID=1872122 RepID=UPI003CFC657B